VTVIATRRERIAEESATPAEMGLSSQLLSAEESLRPASRFVPPPPEMSAEKMAELAEKPAGSRTRKKTAKAKQGELGLELISKGRFDKSEPTIRNGEDLDQPTYIRRGMALN
jgi:cell division protein FtsZ